MSKRGLYKVSREAIEQMYWGRALPIRLAAPMLGISEGYMFYLIRKWGIALRSKAEATKVSIQEGRYHRRMGPENPRWKGRRTLGKGGYVLVGMPEHPDANRNGYVYEHRLIWEQTNGRPVPPGWIVHHLNGIRSDNRPENLMALPRKSHHYALYLNELRQRIRTLEVKIKHLEAERRLI